MEKAVFEFWQLTDCVRWRMNGFKEDYYRMTGVSYNQLLRRIINMVLYHHIRFVFWLRLAEKGSFLGRIQCYRYSRKFGLEISPMAKIARGLYLGHPYHITVGGGVCIGKNVNLHKGCTIGADIRGSREGSPTIGNHVWCGINSTIVGKITIGDDVLIAPGAFVNFDVPSHSVVLGNPGIIHHKEHATDGYIIYTL